MLAVALALIVVTAAAVAQALVKHGMDRVGGRPTYDGHILGWTQQIITDPYVLGGFIMILIAVPFWLEVLSRLPLSVAYPMASFGIVIAVIIGALVLKEHISALRSFGLALTIVGVFVIAKSQ